MNKTQKLKQSMGCSETRNNRHLRFSLLASLLITTASLSAQAIDLGNGLEINNGYLRGGFASSPSGLPRGESYQLGGENQHYRLGNEGDNGIEFLITQKVKAENGASWKLGYMPKSWNGVYYADQAFVEMTGLDIAPEAKFWGGQRRLRIQDVHILDYFFMDYGMNYGAGMTDLNLGFAKLGVGIFNGGSDANHNSYQNNARRINFDISAIKTNEGGVLRILTTTVGGNFQYGQPGGMFSISHNQSNFLVKGLTNSLFLQTSTGHANLQGQFEGLGDATTVTAAGTGGEQPGKKASRIADSINWQAGNFGGQAVVSLENWSLQGSGLAGDGVNVQDWSIGGRVSYAMSNNFKLLLEAANTSRTPDGAAKQTLNKVTFAPTLGLGKDFWSRPEMRFYVSYFQWNDAAAAANATAPDPLTGLQGFGYGGSTSATLAGIQIESWF